MKNTKKAQIFAQPFIIIFALIVAVLILAFGFKSVLDIQQKARYAELLTAQSEIKEVARAYYTLGEGSERIIELRVPKSISCFCFLDKDQANPNNVDAYCNEENPDRLNEKMKLDGGEYQLYVTPSNSYSITKFAIISQLKPNNQNLLCVEIKNSRFKAKITSKGTHVEISKI
mgnify:CR=1 FL=1